MAELDLAKAFDKHVVAARAILASDVLPFRMDVDLAVVNANKGMQVIHAHAADIPMHLPKENLAHLMSIDELAAAVKFAALQVETNIPQPSEMRIKMTRGRELRQQAMPVAKALAANGAIPEPELAPILRGHGQFDTAEDCVSLATLLRKYSATITGKHPLTTAQIDEMAEVGAWLLTHLRPTDAPSPSPKPASTIVEDRNRLATLLIHRYARLQVVAHYFHENDWLDRAPPLGSRSIKPSSHVTPPSTPPVTPP
jgi:hypothetical protein